MVLRVRSGKVTSGVAVVDLNEQFISGSDPTRLMARLFLPPTPSAPEKGSKMVQISVVELDATVPRVRLANVARTRDRARECPRVTSVCKTGTQIRYLQVF